MPQVEFFPGQEFKRAAELHVGDVAWLIHETYIELEDLYEQEFLGPFHVVDIRAKNISTATLYVLWNSFEGHEIQARIGELYVPIIDTIEPPKGHNV